MLHEEVNKKICTYFNIPYGNFLEEDLSKNLTSADKNFFENNVLFPDQIVFGIDKNACQSNVYNEILLAYFYIYKNLKKLKLTADFINNDNVEFIKNMECEKYRQGVDKLCK